MVSGLLRLSAFGKERRDDLDGNLMSEYQYYEFQALDRKLTDLRNKKKRGLSPRRKRMNQKARLQSARHWIPTYKGTNIVKGYKNWFGVDLPCAIRELGMLGVKPDNKYIARSLGSDAARIRAKRETRELDRRDAEVRQCEDSDENFYFIAGYTAGGFPYGITWEEIKDDS